MVVVASFKICLLIKNEKYNSKVINMCVIGCTLMITLWDWLSKDYS